MVNLVSCENFTEELKAAITSASPEDKAAICEALNCGSDLNEIVSAITPNMLEVAEDGKLIVKPANMVSSEENNILEIGTDGKLYVNKTAASVVAGDLVSGDVGNIIVTGSDNKLYARVDPSNPKDFISDSADNAITTGSDGGVFVEKTKDVVPGDLISTDANNIITKGTDSKLFAKVDPVKASDLVSPEAGNSLVIKNDKLYVEEGEVVPSDLVSTNAGNIIVTGSDDKLFAKVDTNTLVSKESNNQIVVKSDGLFVEKGEVVPSDLISTDANNIIVEGSDDKLFAKVDTNTLVSKESNNQIVVKSDGLFVEKGEVVPSDLISTDANNIIVEGSDDKLFAKVDANSLVSSEADNQLTVKSDGKLYVEKSGGISDVDEIISTNEGNLITKGTDEKLLVTGEGLLSSDSGNDLKLGTDKKLFYDRGITWTTEDPGAGSPLETGHIVFVYEEVQTWNITYVSGSEAEDVQNLPSNTSVLNNALYTIPSTPPTRTGYTFNNYSDGSTTHAPGSQITVTADVTLTAQWTQAS